ncbi:hypothetical protein LOAG_17212 [Loa loa]|uniref:DUF370 domain-containing protein n=1 Tax=Loa loa TaxID=7209 RepID=A0A1I7VL91_LOALO|nr:hypothetical protein LOAG_17212 [Loa loa]EJD75685.1 hypothetical protein LOAG_17212 [Loa loa]
MVYHRDQILVTDAKVVLCHATSTADLLHKVKVHITEVEAQRTMRTETYQVVVIERTRICHDVVPSTAFSHDRQAMNRQAYMVIEKRSEGEGAREQAVLPRLSREQDTDN